MSERFLELASRIRELREVCGYTAEQLATELGIDIEVYLEYEKNGEDIPISVIYAISQKFGVDFADIVTGTAAKLYTYQVVKRGHGKEKEVDRFDGYRFEDLAYRFGGKIMQPLLVTIDPSDKVPELLSHKGQEFNMVLEGEMAIVFGHKEISLSAGDAIYFNPELPHAQKCVGNTKARFLTVIAE